MVRGETKQSPQDCSKQANPVDNGQNVETLFSPRFKSVAAMAGWDEEALLIASLVVEDTPDRDFKHKKRSDLRFKTPPSTNSRRKRRAQRRSPVSIHVPVLYLDEEEAAREESEKKNIETKAAVSEKTKTEEDALTEQKSAVSCSNSALPCIDKLKEELSCAICLEICFEPSTTSCGHSFCKKCLRSAADKCGKRCPKCRQLISNGRSCTVNTVLWNTIQLLFPQEVEARKSAGTLSSREAESQIPERAFYGNVGRSIRPPAVASSRDASLRRRGTSSQIEDVTLPLRFQREDFSRLASREASARRSRRRGTPSQDEDAALALRLQREEFMEAFRGNNDQSRRSSISLARANLRAMASRAINTRSRNQAM